MRRLRPIRRRDRQSEREPLPPVADLPPYNGEEETTADYEPDSIEPFVPVSRRYDEYGESEESVVVPERRRRRLRVARPGIHRPSLGIEIRMAPLLAALTLIAAGIAGTMLNMNRLDEEIQEWWPAAVIGIAVLWMLMALIQRHITSFLGGAGLAGIGLSLLMDTQQIAELRETMLGVVLVVIGLGIVVRGLLLRQRTGA